jgi:hypothetical protein
MPRAKATDREFGRISTDYHVVSLERRNQHNRKRTLLKKHLNHSAEVLFCFVLSVIAQ